LFYKMEPKSGKFQMRTNLVLAGIIGAIFTLATDSQAAELRAHHHLQIQLDPASNKLSGIDDITLTAPDTRTLEFRLSERVSQLKVEVNRQPRDFSFDRGRLTLVLESEDPSADLRVTVHYTGIFDDPVPVRPVNADNPGYGVSATISDRGSFLLAGAGWYPDLVGSQATYRLTVRAPAGQIAVSAGRSLGHETSGEQTVSSWAVDYPVDGLSLSVAPYVVTEKTVGKVTAATYLLPHNQDLAQSYLEATAGYIALYSDLFLPLSEICGGRKFFPHRIRLSVLYPYGRQDFAAAVYYSHQLGPRNRPLLVGQRGLRGLCRGQLERGPDHLRGGLSV
jgi:hypothetical protein